MQEVEVKRDGIVFVRFDLPSIAAVLAELLGDDEPMAGLLTAADLVAIEVPSARLIPHGIVGNTNAAIRLRAPVTSSTQSLEPLVFIDGVKNRARAGVRSPEPDSGLVPASYVEDIEVLRGLAATLRYPMAENGVGVVVVKTRSGGGR